MPRAGSRGAAALTWNVTLPQLAVALERLGSEGVPQLEVAVHRRMHAAARAEVARLAPIGSRPKRRRGALVPPGEYRRGIGSSVGRGAYGPVSVLEGLQAGMVSRLTARAPHSAVLEGGLREGRSRRGRQGGRTRGGARQAPVAAGRRLLGSAQAPRGIFGPSIERVEASSEAILAAAIAEVDR